MKEEIMTRLRVEVANSYQDFEDGEGELAFARAKVLAAANVVFSMKFIPDEQKEITKKKGK